jgi:hypothetical protein
VIATIPLLIAAGFAVGAVTTRAWLPALIGAIVGLPAGRALVLSTVAATTASWDRDVSGAIVFALAFVLPGWLLGTGARLARRPAERRRPPWAYVVSGIGILVAVAAVALWLLSGLSRDY